MVEVEFPRRFIHGLSYDADGGYIFCVLPGAAESVH